MGKKERTKTKAWGLVVCVLSEYVMTMYAIGGPLALCRLLGKQGRNRGCVQALHHHDAILSGKVRSQLAEGIAHGGCAPTGSGKKNVPVVRMCSKLFSKLTGSAAKQSIS